MSLETKRRWLLPSEKTEKILDYLIQLRDIQDRDKFLNPRLKDIPSYKELYNSSKAVERIFEHIEKGSKILIHGDYDADGICASSLLWEFMYRELSKHMDKKIDVIPYIPDRLEQGYGLSNKSMEDIKELGVNLVITVDCGIRDKELIQKNQTDNLEFIITDHHQPPEDILEDLDYTVVHQMYPGKEYPNQEISGTAVAYLLVQALREKAGMPEDREYGIDLVGLSTVTDLMPLKGVNRVFVSKGLEIMRQGGRLGLRMLALRAKLDLKSLASYHLGFVLGPRINAAGRIGSPLQAVKLLVSQDESTCREIANDLENTNFQRQKMTREILDLASQEVLDESNLIFVIGDGWHEGIIGLVAGKLQEKYYKPVIVATNKEGIVKASARSIKGFNITKALEKFSDYLEKYGGHELAAGFTMKEESVEEFKKEIVQHANEKLSKEDLVPELKIDLLLETEQVHMGLIEDISKLEPLGYGNPKPRICIQGVEIKKKYVIGKDENHLKLFVQGNSVDYLTLLLFGCDEDVKKLQVGNIIDVVGYPDLNVWNGQENVQFHVKEWRYLE